MPHNRFFSPDLASNSIVLSDAEFHHLAHVMRIKENQRVELVDGKGCLAYGIVSKLMRSEAHVEITEKTLLEQPKIQLSLAIASPKFSHLELVLEKSTEIGIERFIIFETQHSEKLPSSDSQKKRMESILISALKQSGRPFLPEIVILKNSEDLKKIGEERFFCHLDQEAKKIDTLTFHSKNILVVVGPERGFSEKDVKFLMEDIKCRPISLGPYIMRMETACISASCLFTQKISWENLKVYP